MKPKSTTSRRSRKSPSPRPKKPYADFPLYAHPLGYWSKKVRGTIRHFGRWGRVINGKLTPVREDGAWQDALAKYQAQRDDLQAAREPREQSSDDVLTVGQLCNRFLTTKKRMRLDTGKMTARSFVEYRETTDIVVAKFGGDRPVDDLRPDDFESLLAAVSKRWGPVRQGNFVVRVRSVFKYALLNGLVSKPIAFGSDFTQPGRKEMRRLRAKNERQDGKKTLTAAEIRTLLDAAPPQLKAMILLGVNCGFGNTDFALLPERAVDLDGGWIDYARSKTGIDRRIPLWRETIAALKVAIAERPPLRSDKAKGLVFVTARGNSWISVSKMKMKVGDEELVVGQDMAHPVTVAIGKLMRDVGVHRRGLGAYSMRHSFRTVADAVPDRVAIDCIMGHVDDSMGAHYTHGIDDSRLHAVVNHVHDWLFPQPATAPTDRATKPTRERKPSKPKAKRSESSDDSRPRLRIVG